MMSFARYLPLSLAPCRYFIPSARFYPRSPSVRLSDPARPVARCAARGKSAAQWRTRRRKRCCDGVETWRETRKRGSAQRGKRAARVRCAKNPRNAQKICAQARALMATLTRRRRRDFPRRRVQPTDRTATRQNTHARSHVYSGCFCHEFPCAKPTRAAMACFDAIPTLFVISYRMSLMVIYIERCVMAVPQYADYAPS